MSIEILSNGNGLCDSCDLPNNVFDIDINKCDIVISLCNDCIDELMEKLRKAR